ncbi:hypothetical protein HMPREF9135_0312 [Segatella baroniae F0067]|uniref:Uncharacterized protein n=1 Tax=Segatella baroniae F0067 TaxID=1115809 RepID=U2QMN8_9BACT|nr:hypothetical protein HMPREF9135_0312 [Segatella baroniae F0067]
MALSLSVFSFSRRPLAALYNRRFSSIPAPVPLYLLRVALKCQVRMRPMLRVNS